MLERRAAFVKDTPADTLTAVLNEPPPPLTPTDERPSQSALNLITRRCLAKDPTERFQTARDLAFVLSSFGDSTATETPLAATAAVDATVSGRRSVVGFAVAAGAVLLSAAVAVGMRAGWFSHRAAGSPIEFLVPPPANTWFASAPLPGLDPTAPLIGISPDGRTIAFVSTNDAGLRQLWVRSIDNGTPRPIEGTNGASSWPFWSPDSRFMVFAADGVLSKVEVATGAIERLCKLPDQGAATPFVTGTWSDGTILFSIGPAGLYRVSASGGSVQTVTTLDQPRRDNYHSWPQFLSDKRFLLFVRTEQSDTTGIYTGSLDSSNLTLITTAASRGVYADGRLLWMIEDHLAAQPFDPELPRLSGRPDTVATGIFRGAGRTPAFWASNTGTLVYAVGGSSPRQFRWLNRSGVPIGEVGAAGDYWSFDLTPDGSHIVAEVRKEGTSPRSTLTVIDTSRMVASALTAGELNDTDPRYGPLGDIAFARNTGDTTGIVRMDANGGHPSVLVPRDKAPVIWLEDWAGASAGVIYRTALDTSVWQALPGVSARKLTSTREPAEQAQLSPDAHWIAYNNADSGRPEVYLSPTSGTGQRWQVSAAGGVQALWRGDGRELYYLGLDGGVYAVDISEGRDAPQPSKPRLLFQSRLPVLSSVVEQYRVTGDGQRFLFCMPLTAVRQEPLRVVIDWASRLTPPD